MKGTTYLAPEAALALSGWGASGGGDGSSVALEWAARSMGSPLQSFDLDRLTVAAGGRLIVLADGGGSELDGHGSTAALDAVLHYFAAHGLRASTLASSAPTATAHHVRASFLRAHAAVVAEASSVAVGEPLRTTLLVAAFGASHVAIGNVGSVFGYRLRTGSVDLLTWHEGLDGPEMSVDPSSTSRWQGRRLPPAVLGLAIAPEPEVTVQELRADDTYLFCSDGVAHALSEHDLQACLTDHPPPRRACDEVLRAARAAGSTDDATVAVVTVVPEPDLPTAA